MEQRRQDYNMRVRTGRKGVDDACDGLSVQSGLNTWAAGRVLRAVAEVHGNGVSNSISAVLGDPSSKIGRAEVLADIRNTVVREMVSE